MVGTSDRAGCACSNAADGVVIPEGSYHFIRYRAEFEAAAKRLEQISRMVRQG